MFLNTTDVQTVMQARPEQNDMPSQFLFVSVSWNKILPAMIATSVNDATSASVLLKNAAT